MSGAAVPPSPLAASPVVAAAAATPSAQESALAAEGLGARAPRRGIPTWAWIVAAGIVLLIILAIVGEIIRTERGGNTRTYSVISGRDPICDIAGTNACSVGTGYDEATADSCKARCDRTAGCQAVLYRRQGLNPQGQNCWLKRFNKLPPDTKASSSVDFYYVTSSQPPHPAGH
jgi:hypothetical protein